MSLCKGVIIIRFTSLLPMPGRMKKTINYQPFSGEV